MSDGPDAASRLTISLPRGSKAIDIIITYIVEAWAIDHAAGRVDVVASTDKLTVQFTDPLDMSLWVLNPPLG